MHTTAVDIDSGRGDEARSVCVRSAVPRFGTPSRAPMPCKRLGKQMLQGPSFAKSKRRIQYGIRRASKTLCRGTAHHDGTALYGAPLAYGAMARSKSLPFVPLLSCPNSARSSLTGTSNSGCHSASGHGRRVQHRTAPAQVGNHTSTRPTGRMLLHSYRTTLTQSQRSAHSPVLTAHSASFFSAGQGFLVQGVPLWPVPVVGALRAL